LATRVAREDERSAKLHINLRTSPRGGGVRAMAGYFRIDTG